MFEGDYSKKVWIISIIMALGCIIMDIYILMTDTGIMRESVWFSLPLVTFMLYKCIQGLIKKIKEEKENQ